MMNFTDTRASINVTDTKNNKVANETLIKSDTTTWPSGKLPVEGEDVEIAPGENVVLDISTPRLFKLTVNGRLTFLNDAKEPKNLTLNTNLLYVRAGELIIGNQTHPYNGEAKIVLYGEPNDETLAYSMTVETGNKVLAIVGKV